MEKNKSIIIQKQVKDNAHDLQTELLAMKNWEEKIKQAELQLKHMDSNHAQVLPPVRKKKNNTRTKLKTKENGSKAKRIKSYDYSAWDHYDAEKACEEIDKENESEDSGEEILSKEELERKHEEATTHKVLGNNYVKEQKWDKAMACYNEAIKIFPYDAVFYANRALCHLKMDNLYSAEADCTSAIQRDECYLKAYHRRATARMALKQCKEAVQDLKKLLSLEPSNKEAQKMLSIALKSLHDSNTVTINGVKDSAIQDIQEKSSKVKNKEESSVSKKEDTKKDNKLMPNLQRNVSQDIQQNKQITKKSLKNYDWLPKIDEDVDVVQPLKKLPHQRTNHNTLKSIPIKIADLSKQISLNLHKDDLSQKSELKKPLIVEMHRKSIKTEKEHVLNIEEINFSIPCTAVQFFNDWRKYQSSEIRYKYLKQIPPELIPSIVQDAMELDIFSEIIWILKTKFISNKDRVFQYLKNLSEIKRFSMLMMFLDKNIKEDLKILFDFCNEFEGYTDESIEEFRNKYEI
ncbi:RNA polymerase II-associated protein 3-like [Chelonus insularis]|uniref:RNA polymerase II-associated protein 3-like n=1 Tax=Chelonus insularis TaxID=460826 RepID=UPI00158C79B2|nr:RNA polymerase II-associated protein 3-like [Chelonus insularis]